MLHLNKITPDWSRTHEQKETSQPLTLPLRLLTHWISTGSLENSGNFNRVNYSCSSVRASILQPSRDTVNLTNVCFSCYHSVGAHQQENRRWQGNILTVGEGADKHRCFATTALAMSKVEGICVRRRCQVGVSHWQTSMNIENEYRSCSSINVQQHNPLQIRQHRNYSVKAESEVHVAQSETSGPVGQKLEWSGFSSWTRWRIFSK